MRDNPSGGRARGRWLRVEGLEDRAVPAAIDLLYANRVGTASGQTEVVVLDGADRTRVAETIVTPLHETGPDFDLQFVDFNGDGETDLAAVKKRGGSGAVEVHVLDGADRFGSFLAHTPTGMAPAPDAAAFSLADVTGDGTLDLALVLRGHTGSGTTEAHAVSGESGFRDFVLHSTTALGPSDPSRAFAWADATGDGRADLWFVDPVGGSGPADLHVLDQATGFQTFALSVATAVGPFPDGVRLHLADLDGEGRPEIVLDAPAGAAVRRFVLNGDDPAGPPAEVEFEPAGAVRGTPDDDVIVVRDRAGDPAWFEATVNGCVVRVGRWDRVAEIAVDAGGGNDRVEAGESRVPVRVAGGDGDDDLIGSEFADDLDGGDGNDRVTALGGYDTITGGAGDDKLDGYAGADVIRGGDGDDILGGGTGADDLDGEGGDDTVYGHEDADAVAGGDGADRLFGSEDRDTFAADDADTLPDLDLSPAVRAAADALGLPTSDEADTADGRGRFADFADGAVYSHPELGTFAVAGAIFRHWDGLGREASDLGFPTADAEEVEGGTAARFEGGTLFLDAATGEVGRRTDPPVVPPTEPPVEPPEEPPIVVICPGPPEESPVDPPSEGPPVEGPPVETPPVVEVPPDIETPPVSVAPPPTPTESPPPPVPPAPPAEEPEPTWTWTGFAVGTDAGRPGVVTAYNPDRTVRFTAPAFADGFAGGVRVATADFTGDGVPDVVVGTGPGAASRVRVLDGKTQREVFALAPFEAAFTGGVYVAAADLTGDGVPDLIVTPDEGGGPRVDVYDGATRRRVASFFGIDDANFRGGARAAAGDISGDGRADLVVVAGFGGGPRVAGFDGTTLTSGRRKLFADFFAFEQSLRNGVYVTVGDLDADGFADLIAGGGPGGGPRVLALAGRDLAAGRPRPVGNFFASDPADRGGVRLAVTDADGDARADLVVGSGAGAGSRVTVYAGRTVRADAPPPAALDLDAFPGFAGGVFVG